MKKQTLAIEYDYDFMVFAISCHEPDYKFCMQLNEKLGLQLEKETALELAYKQYESSFLFSFFTYTNEVQQLDYYLVANKSYNQVEKIKIIEKEKSPSLFGEDHKKLNGVNGLFLPELAAYDYILILKTSYQPKLATLIENRINGIDFVIKTTYIEVNDLVSKSNLILD